MNVDIIGGSGFIGSRLCALLERDDAYDVRIVDKERSTDYGALSEVADVRSLSQLQAALRPRSALVNLAAEHRDDVRPLSLYREVNVDGARNVCEAARRLGSTHITFTSSVAVYGFAPPDTDEAGAIAAWNEYGQTKYEAEQIYAAWQREDPHHRTLAVVRPTVVFGERNRGNVYNLLRQVASGRFVMIGTGQNRKSMAYVENVAAFIKHTLSFSPGIHVYNYVDKPDFTMKELVNEVRSALGRSPRATIRLPVRAGLAVGHIFDLLSRASGRTFPISAVRVRKFCSESVFASSAHRTGFSPPVPLADGLRRTIDSEFINPTRGKSVFFTE